MSPTPKTQTAVCATQTPPHPLPNSHSHLGLKLSAPNSHFINQDDLSSCEFISLSVQDNSGAVVLRRGFISETNYPLGEHPALMAIPGPWMSILRLGGPKIGVPPCQTISVWLYIQLGWQLNSSKNKNTNWPVFISVLEKYSKCFQQVVCGTTV